MKINRIRLERLLARGKKILENWRGSSHQVYVWDRVDEYHTMWKAVADKAGAELHVLDNDVWEIRLNGKRTRILNDKLEYDNPVTLIMAGRKQLIYELLKKHGLRVPEYAVFSLDDLDTPLRFLKKHPGGCVIKPADGTSSGQGVTTHVTDKNEMRKAIILASLYCRSLIIEPMIAGECYRLLVLRGEVIHAVRRSGVWLGGDGVSTVKEIAEKTSHGLINDRDCHFTLKSQGISLDSVPSKGVRFLFKSNGSALSSNRELRTVYDSDVSDEVSDQIKKDAVEAAAVAGCEFVGVDFIAIGMDDTLEKCKGYINELNTTPGLHHHAKFSNAEHSEVALRAILPLLQ